MVRGSIESISRIKSIQLRFKHNWIKPKGFDTGIKLYNCITRSKEPFILQQNRCLKWYTCGPTVYDSAHIGHASCYMKLDIIQKILRNYFKVNLVTAMNITDIDDKIIKRANEQKMNNKNLVEIYEKEFWQDLASLGISQPDIVIRVTENIDLIINFIKKLEQDGFAYKAKDNSVYFNVESFQRYGKLQNFGREELEKNETFIKKSVMDFALWKSSQEGEPSWNSPWGNGRPGWHIECSTLASHLLGSNIDVHAGGIDLRFPHHENEEAQSCAYHGTSQWINYWIHTGHLSIKGSEKMSKSLKNTISIQDLLKKSSAETFRMACIMSRYKNNMEYGDELLTMAKNTMKVYQNFIESCSAFQKGLLKSSVNSDILMENLEKSSQEIHHALCDDFNTPKVLKILNELISLTNSMFYNSPAQSFKMNNEVSSVILIQNMVQNTLNAFGINFENQSMQSENFVEIMNILNEFRQDIRNLGIANKNVELLKMCDNVRDSLKNLDIILKDHKNTTSWSKSI